MATTPEFLNYLIQQINRPQSVRSIKMMGEYVVYYDNKVVALVCDNQLFVKDTSIGRDFLGEFTLAPAYPGAKPSLLIEAIENSEHLAKLIELTASVLPPPKLKSQKLKRR